MESNSLVDLYRNHPIIRQIIDELKTEGVKKCHCKGLSGSSGVLLSAILFNQIKRNQLIILDDKEQASYFFDDLCTMGLDTQVLFFPSSYKRSVLYEKVDPDNLIFRTDVLNRLTHGEGPFAIVTYPEALIEKVISGSALESNTLQIHKSDRLSQDFIAEVLYSYGFERVDFVYEPGQYSIRGSLVDIFSFASENPYRIDFFGEEVESIRSFDIETQLSKDSYGKINIIPNIQEGLGKEERVSLAEFIKSPTYIIANDLKFITGKIDDIYEQSIQKALARTETDGTSFSVRKQLLKGSQLLKDLDRYTLVETGNQTILKEAKTFIFHTAPQPVFNKNFELLGENLYENTQAGYQNIILFPNEKQIDRLRAIFKDNGHKVEFEPFLTVLNEGFIDYDLKVCCYTDHQIFERYHRFRMQENKPNRQSMTIKELNMLHPGDYVVHIDHGIGKFSGLVRMEVNGKMQEVIKLEFRDHDVIFVSIHSLHRISKYKGKDGIEPNISKLGSGAWQKIKNRTKAKVKDIARELILLYAKRKDEQGYSFTPDSYLQEELEASFIYEDTPDQIKATQAVKEDMEKPIPMDRLICGDVGFGKTEIAIRAAFKAVTDSKQVAVLVPTTILALQHFKTFTDRLKDFPVRVEYISRLRKSTEITRIKKEVKEGKVDILIGTHRIVNKDIQFKDLGLLIVDEEQKFGVSVKEKLKQIKVNVDTLTLTATPIPRTLQFSLMGARDLSIINTPPPNRYPIQTEVYEFNEDIIREAINFELARGGQVFIIHNRIQNISEVDNLIRRLCPKARTIVGHGQMDGDRLEKIMLSFINGEYDVLISTTIIESGLDIPNANTIIINNANNFGLSEMHQLRGRVGRSNKKAFCYLLAPPLHSLTEEARRRLKAIEEFSELGSGFNLSMQDLDIRGAGNLLGAEQSGFIADIGFETYHRILNEAVEELKQDEFKDLFVDEKKDQAAQKFLNIKFVNDCQIDTDMELLFPDSYITNTSERILLYRELDNIEDEEGLNAFRNNLIDRFGKIPTETEELLEVVNLRWLAIALGMEKIILKEKRMICHFISNQNSPFYKTKEFGFILQYVATHPKNCKMKESLQKLTVTFNGINSISDARNLFSLITSTTVPVTE